MAKIDFKNVEMEYSKISNEEKVDFINGWFEKQYGVAVLEDGNYTITTNPNIGMTVINYITDHYDEKANSYSYSFNLSSIMARASEEGLNEYDLNLEWRKYLNQRIPNYIEYFKYIQNLMLEDYVKKQKARIEKEVRDISEESSESSK